jgi:catechol 2,3-dioxygenase-like lactoylglutathione lyase family enzyme
MLDHMILTVSDIKRSLAFYEAALKPLQIRFFMPYIGEDGHPDLWGFGDGKKAFFWLKQGKPDPTAIHWGFVAENNKRSMNSTRPPCPLVPETTFLPAHDWNTIRDTTRPTYSIPTGIRSRSHIRASVKASGQLDAFDRHGRTIQRASACR